MRFALLALAALVVALVVSAEPGPGGVSASSEARISGDADCDLSINEFDALGVVQVVAGLDPQLDCMDLADVNCDGVVDLDDMLEILKYSADLPLGELPDECAGVGSAGGLPPLIVNVDTSIEVIPATIAGIDGGPARPVAAVVDDDGFKSLFVENELVIVTGNLTLLNEFLDRWGAIVVKSLNPADAGLLLPAIHLVRLPDLAGIDVSQLAEDLRALHGDSWGQFDVSSEAGLGLLAVAASEAAGGLQIDLNWIAEGGTLDQRQIAEAATGPSFWSPNPFNWPYMNRGSAQDIGVADAWRALSAAGKLGNKATIAILDGGFAPNPDFPAGFEMNGSANVPNPASCTAGSPCPWHGTVVTAAAMGVPDNGFGVAGPAGPIADAVLTQSPSLDLFEILEYVFLSIPATAYPFPTVLNISAGVAIPSELCLTGICLLMDGITAGLRNLGLVIVSAAMNDSTDVDAERCINLLLGSICYEKRAHIPCELTDVICVGGLEWDSTIRNAQSNYGTADEADSVDIYGPMIQFTTPTPEKGIERRNCGTSCASPFVAGVVALIKAANPGLGSDELADILIGTAHHAAADPGVPRWVNAYGAVISVLGNEPPELEIELDSGTYTGGVPFPLSAFLTDPEDLPFSSGWTGLPTIQWTSSIDGVIGNAPFTSPVLLSYGTHTITATATDSAGSVITDIRTWNIVNYPPTVDLLTPADGVQLFQGQQVILRGTSADQNRASGVLDDDEVQWFTAPVGNPTSRTLVGTGHRLRASFLEGVYLLTFVGTDEGGATDEESITINVGPTPLDFPPTAEVTSVDPTFACNPGPNYYYTLNGVADDPEDGNLSGASLVWTRSVNGGTPSFVGTGNSFQASTSGLVNGDVVRFILTATDSNSGTGTDFVDVNHGCFF